MNACLEGFLYLGGGSGELDPSTSPRQRRCREPVALEPRYDGSHIGGRISVSIGKGSRGEPMMVFRRLGIEQVSQFGIERLALRRRWLQQEQHAVQAGFSRGRAKIG